MLSFNNGESAFDDLGATAGESIGARVALTFVYTYRLRLFMCTGGRYMCVADGKDVTST